MSNPLPPSHPNLPHVFLLSLQALDANLRNLSTSKYIQGSWGNTVSVIQSIKNVPPLFVALYEASTPFIPIEPPKEKRSPSPAQGCILL